MQPRPGFALALGGGSAKGLAHIGILKVLEEAEIPIHAIAGTSMGAVIGGLYAAQCLDAYETLIRGIDRRSSLLFLDPILPNSGFFAGKRLENLLDSVLSGRHIEYLKIPFCAVAADLNSGEEIRLSQGELVGAMRASFAIPGFFTPKKWNGRWLVDGGLAAPVPVAAAQAFGAPRVIAVDLQTGCLGNQPPLTDSVSTGDRMDRTHTKAELRLQDLLENPRIPQRLKTVLSEFVERSESAGSRLRERAERVWQRMGRGDLERPPGLWQTVNASTTIMQANLFRLQAEKFRPDIILRPELPHIGLLDFSKADEIIREGERVAREALQSGVFDVEEQATDKGSAMENIRRLFRAG